VKKIDVYEMRIETYPYGETSSPNPSPTIEVENVSFLYYFTLKD
jgi:hypothetical protein